MWRNVRYRRHIVAAVVYTIGMMTIDAAVAHAQRLWVQNYTPQTGMRASPVLDVFQDMQGYLWLGWTHGLVRYDGASFMYLSTQDGLSYDTVNNILEYPSGSLWIATNGGGVDRYVDGQWQHFPVNPADADAPENRVNVLYRWNGTLWAGTDNGLYVLHGHRWHRVHVALPLYDAGVFALIAENDTVLWVGASSGLYRCRRVGNGILDILNVFPIHEARTLLWDADGVLWVGSRDGLERIDPRHGRIPLPDGLKPLERVSIASLYRDQRGRLWIGTAHHGLYRYLPNGVLEHHTVAQGLSGNSVYRILRDREGNIWLATEGGLSKIPDDRFVHYTVADGLPTYHTTVVLPDRDGSVWIGTARGLVHMLGQQKEVLTPQHGLTGWYITSLVRDRDGAVWVGTGHGLSRITRTGSRYRVHTLFHSGDSTHRVLSLFVDRRGWVWMGTEWDVRVWNGQRIFRFHRLYRWIGRRPTVRAIYRDRYGDLWAGLWWDGLVRLRVRITPDGQIVWRFRKWYRRADGLPDERIRAIYEDHRGNLWVGTREGGLVQIIRRGPRVQQLRVWTTADGLLSNAVLCITEDRAHRLWIGTGLGYNIVRVHGDRIVHVGRLTIDEGLIGHTVMDCTWDMHGRLWTATFTGVTRFASRVPRPMAPPPPVYITDVRVQGRPVPFTGQQRRLELPYHQNQLTIRFVGISLKNEYQVRYRFMLEGLDTTWHPITGQRSVHYAELPPGNYTFKVQARNADGVWSSQPAVFTFRILPPFWHRWWFWVIVGGLVTGGIIAAHLLRVRHLLALERMRTRIATDLHDDLGSTLGSISIFSEIARRSIADDHPDAAHLLERIGESARTLMGSLREMIWTMQPENDSLKELVARIERFAREVLEPADITYIVRAAPDLSDVRISMEVRRNLYLVAKEAIYNAVRHANCSQVAVMFTRSGRLLCMSIRDNGTGLPDVAPPGNGIPNMHRRARAIGAHLEIRSEPGLGTTVTMYVRI